MIEIIVSKHIARHVARGDQNSHQVLNVYMPDSQQVSLTAFHCLIMTKWLNNEACASQNIVIPKHDEAIIVICIAITNICIIPWERLTYQWLEVSETVWTPSAVLVLHFTFTRILVSQETEHIRETLTWGGLWTSSSYHIEAEMK